MMKEFQAENDRRETNEGSPSLSPSPREHLTPPTIVSVKGHRMNTVRGIDHHRLKKTIRSMFRFLNVRQRISVIQLIRHRFHCLPEDSDRRIIILLRLVHNRKSIFSCLRKLLFLAKLISCKKTLCVCPFPRDEAHLVFIDKKDEFGLFIVE